MATFVYILVHRWHAGAFANLMRLLKQDNGEQIGFTVWQAQLQAILRTSRSLTLSKLAAVPDLVPTLTAMLKAAEQDQQVLLQVSATQIAIASCCLTKLPILPV